MFCRHCGKAVTDKAVVCTGCGHAIDGSGLHAGSGRPWNVFVVVALVIATLFMPPVGLVLGPMGLMDESKKVQGAVLTTVGIFMTILMVAIILGL
ncbi:MAG: hypothetical protein RLZZ226_2206 [Pseudomonadota bacterium]